MNAYRGLLGALAAAPDLTGALCAGRAHLFDEAAPGEHEDAVAARHGAALQLCVICPVRSPCRAYFLSLPPAKRPGGVIAGRVHRWQPTTRKKKERTA